jgi:hypothetical protein
VGLELGSNLTVAGDWVVLVVNFVAGSDFARINAGETGFCCIKMIGIAALRVNPCIGSLLVIEYDDVHDVFV